MLRENKLKQFRIRYLIKNGMEIDCLFAFIMLRIVHDLWESYFMSVPGLKN